MNGFLLVNKPAGPSSHDVVKQVRKVARTRQVGHAGTLDPAAAGLLTLAIGHCTKLLQFLVLKDKSYTFDIVFGTQTDTDDDTGEVLFKSSFAHVDEDLIRSSLEQFVGTNLEQIPPNISAVRIDGQRAHALTRDGVDFEMPTRQVDIYQITLLSYDVATGTAKMSMDCGSGTYVRAFCRDFGHRLGTHAHAKHIFRTKVGIFSVTDAVPLAELTRETIGDYLLTDQEMLGLNLKVRVEDEYAWRLGMGQKVFIKGDKSFNPSNITEYISVIDEHNELIGVGVPHRIDDDGFVLAPKTILKPRYGTERR